MINVATVFNDIKTPEQHLKRLNVDYRIYRRNDWRNSK